MSLSKVSSPSLLISWFQISKSYFFKNYSDWQDCEWPHFACKILRLQKPRQQLVHREQGAQPRCRTGREVAAQGGNSIKQNWLEFYLQKRFEFWLEIPYTITKFKNGKFKHVTESKWNLYQFFKPKIEPKLLLLNCHPRCRSGRYPPPRKMMRRAVSCSIAYS